MKTIVTIILTNLRVGMPTLTQRYAEFNKKIFLKKFLCGIPARIK